MYRPCVGIGIHTAQYLERATRRLGAGHVCSLFALIHPASRFSSPAKIAPPRPWLQPASTTTPAWPWTGTCTCTCTCTWAGGASSSKAPTLRS
ncbi:predicted protein [Plenodomus lingam JN3]|uniref:Predicted protein n=1 Tax=Leptosphaeria maculans (strain JN3 / isolate v23.1.3 / race Av1-4-5-6-7-8) TaxID=985895 RepID=E4ZK89_LEPMJ|nr:predicted protein [Plenodomus lingam JN3]CBX91684.1 predicted protein [Plenodomus lingam JN3]